MNSRNRSWCVLPQKESRVAKEAGVCNEDQVHKAILHQLSGNLIISIVLFPLMLK